MTAYLEQDKPCYLVAEIGVNHGGDVALARRMVDAAKQAGADAVKFQTFTAERLALRSTPKVDYQKTTTAAEESHFEMLKQLELSEAGHRELLDYCHTAGIDFVSTPYDIDSARFLLSLGVSQFKTASADIVDLPLHEFLAGTGKPVMVATGMATLGEIDEAVQCYGDAGRKRLALLHCVSNYPCSDQSLNMRAMRTLADAFRLPVGFSDHSIDHQAAVIAVALGARVIEKHFTLDKALPGPDHKASSTPDEFATLVNAVRRAELSLGSPLKRCQSEEACMARVSRKSVVTLAPIARGQYLDRALLTMMRPGTGLAARDIPRITQLRARHDLPAGHLLAWEDLE
jgi:sialic acid synthase SpsE